MRKFLVSAALSIGFLSGSALLYGQTAIPPVDQSRFRPIGKQVPGAQPAPPPAPEIAPAPVPTPAAATSAPPPIQYFSLQHLTLDQMDAPDASILRKREREIGLQAQFYGYDLSVGSWGDEQAVCGFPSDHFMVRYRSVDSAGTESLFVAVVPREAGRIWIVPVLSHGVTPYKPAPVDPRNYQLFSQVVAPEIVKTEAKPSGKWLRLAVCYAEMTGGRPRVPDRPELEPTMMNAPVPTLGISTSGEEHEVRFVDPLSAAEYRLWAITFDGTGHVSNVSADMHSFGGPDTVHPSAPLAQTASQPAPSPFKQVPPPAAPDFKPMPNAALPAR